jgi:hypothetical protein
MRAYQPASDGYAERGGVKLYYEVHGSGEPTVFLLPTWSIIHSRHWKMQIPYLARHCRVVTFDGRGNGRSDRPQAGYDEREFAADAGVAQAARVTRETGAVCQRRAGVNGRANGAYGAFFLVTGRGVRPSFRFQPAVPATQAGKQSLIRAGRGVDRADRVAVLCCCTRRSNCSNFASYLWS